jgi:hypothetical protein
MFSELTFQWKLRRMQAGRRTVMGRFQDSFADAVERKASAEEIEKIKDKEYADLNEWDEEIQIITSAHLIEQAVRLQIPLPDRKNGGFWEVSRFLGHDILSKEGIAKLRTEVRAEQKASWEFWANRVTLALALIGSIFGVLAYFKK